jgi:hypothetical protein
MTDQERLVDIKKSFGGRWTHLDIKWLIEQAEKVERYEKALEEINDYIPTDNKSRDVHNLKTIADKTLK